MSKISYCSLEEAWGESFKKNNDDNNNNNNKNNNNNIITNRNKYDTLNKESIIERENVISNMNNIERNKKPENNTIVNYDKYRFNPENKVNSKSNEINYTPFEESLEKKYLKDKLLFLEHELKKYKSLIDKSENNKKISNKDYNDYNNENILENFKNSNNSNSNEYVNNYSSNDMVDLFLLIIIGLIVIFVMNSIFNIGKKIGASGKS